ncbi:Fc receptor-like protein 5 isoform X1 [Haplochromis burtoni]|uniref:Fc receptor-like protein 5 isoform X1 n=1 Tax=Haplochromis burtoni TaxID=8153 RepID=UPI001C2CFA00|nr:Fc receptor-like protein 5 isoform X1 [Haplochromis burtoni]
MEVRFPAIRLLRNVLTLLVIVVECSDSQTYYSGFPKVVPNRQQFFQTEPITISCEGLNGLIGWRVMKKTKADVRRCASFWKTPTGPCNIINAYPSTDSGEYWCEHGEIQKSNSVNITVTESHVILESPVYPVIEGENMALHCRKKDSTSNYTAKFYKNSISIGSSSSGNIMIPTVSKSDGGLYKCSIVDTGDSPQSWLNIKGHGLSKPTGLIVLRSLGLMCLLVTCLLSVGLLRYWKHKLSLEVLKQKNKVL